MKKNSITTLLIMAASLLTSCGTFNEGSNGEDITTSSLKHELNNCYAEISILERQVDLLESAVNSLHDEIANTSEESRSIVHDKTKTLHSKVGTLEKKTGSLVADVGTIKKHSNETASSLKALQKQLQKLENSSKSSQDNITALEGAMRSLMAAMQPSGSGRAVASLNRGDTHTYRVKTGDTLEKIARKNNTSVDAIKELNQLRSEDFIIAGQELLIP